MSNNSDKLLALVRDHENYILQEFATEVIGIGALFFAYAELHPYPHLRLLIALIGLGSSVAIAMHTFGVSKDRKEILDYLDKQIKEVEKTGKAKTDGEELRKTLKEIGSWRGRWPYLAIYQPSLRIIPYFASLVALAWLVLIISITSVIWYSYVIPFIYYEYTAVAFLFLTLLFIAVRRVQDWNKFKEDTDQKSH